MASASNSRRSRHRSGGDGARLPRFANGGERGREALGQGREGCSRTRWTADKRCGPSGQRQRRRRRDRDGGRRGDSAEPEHPGPGCRSRCGSRRSRTGLIAEGRFRRQAAHHLGQGRDDDVHRRRGPGQPGRHRTWPCPVPDGERRRLHHLPTGWHESSREPRRGHDRSGHHRRH